MELYLKLTETGLHIHVQFSWIALAAARKAIMATLATLATALAASGLLELFSRLGQ
jgi:hypothetical protein